MLSTHVYTVSILYTVSTLYLHVLLIWQKVFSKWGDPSHHEFEFCCIIQIIQYSYHNFGLCSLHAITVSGWPMCRTRSSTCLSPMGMMGSSIGRPQPLQTPWRSSWIVSFDYFELCLSWRCFWNPWAVPAGMVALSERGTLRFGHGKFRSKSIRDTVLLFALPFGLLNRSREM